MANNMTNIPASLEEDVKVQNYISRLADLRSTGVTRISDLKQQIHSAKKSKMLAQETKAKLVEDCKKQIDAAKADDIPFHPLNSTEFLNSSATS